MIALVRQLCQAKKLEIKNEMKGLSFLFVNLPSNTVQPKDLLSWFDSLNSERKLFIHKKFILD